MFALYLERQSCSDGIKGISEKYSGDSCSWSRKKAVEVSFMANQVSKYGFVEFVRSELSGSIWENANHLSSIAFIKGCQVFYLNNFVQAWNHP